MFGLLGLAPGPDIGLMAAAALAGVEVNHARRILFALEQASLLISDGRGRYRMHDLVRRYAADRGAHVVGAEQGAAMRRVLDFYLRTAHKGDRALYPHSTPIALDPPPADVPTLALTVHTAMTWFETEHICLMAAQRTAAALGRARTTWQMAWAMDTFLHRQGRISDYLAVWEIARVAADRLDDKSQQALASRRLAHALAQVGRLDTALSHLDEALALASTIDDVENQAHTHRIMAWVHGAQHRYAQACAHAQDALRLYQSLGVSTREADALNTIGWYMAKDGRYQQALTHCREALAMQRQHCDRDGMASTLDSLGHIAHHTGESALAIDYYQEALALRRELGNVYEEANTLDGMSAPYIALGRHADARAVLEALELYEEQERTADTARLREQLRSMH